MVRTAKIEILEGAAAGCHKCTVDGVVGIDIVAYRIPHELLQNSRARKRYESACPELRQSGIYFLLSKNGDGRKSVYIGQAKRRMDKKTKEENGVLFRALQNHKTKKDSTIDDWDEAVMFVGPNEESLRQYMDSLENKFYLRAVSTGNYEVRNGNVPTAIDHPRDVSNVIENANTMLVAMGHYVLEPLPLGKVVVDPPKPPNDGPVPDSCTLGDEKAELLTGRHIVKFKYLGNEQPVSSWVDMFEQVVKILHQKNKSVLANLAKQDSVPGIYVSSSEGGLRKAVKIDDRVYFEGNTSTKDKILQLRRLFDLYNKTDKTDKTALVFFYRSKA